MNTKKIIAKNTPLIIVDMQNGFVNEKSKHIIPVVRSLLNKWENLGGTVIFTRFNNKPDSFWRKLIHWNRLASAPETDIISELPTNNHLIIDKYSYTSLTEEIKLKARKESWSTAIICGIATESCVLKTAVDMFESEIVPLVITDASASHAGDEVHQAGLLVLGRFIGKEQLILSEKLLSIVE